MTDRWNKLRILTEWLGQGRTLELEGVSGEVALTKMNREKADVRVK